MNWIIPNRFIAFMGPEDNSRVKYNIKLWSTEDYVNHFRNLNIKAVFRLNRPDTYNKNKFVNHSIDH